MKWQFEISDCPRNSRYPVIATQIGDNGVRKGPFYLTINDLIQALESGTKSFNFLAEDSISDRTPILPKGTIRYATNRTKTVVVVSMEIDKKYWDIRYEDDKNFYTLGFPRMIVQYTVNMSEGYLSNMKIFAVKDDKKPIIDTTPLFQFPFPNVHDNGSVCWGKNERIQVKSLVELERGFQWFVSAPFNEDLGVKTTLGIPNFRMYIEKFENQPFQDEWLIEMNKTFGDIK